MGTGKETCTPTDSLGYVTLVPDAKTLTTLPRQPKDLSVAETRMLNVEGYSRLWLRVKYTAAISTDVVVSVWGKKWDGNWTSLYTSQATPALTQTLTDTIATDCSDGTNYWSHAQYGYDCRGCSWIQVVVTTAGISAGAVSIEGARS